MCLNMNFALSVFDHFGKRLEIFSKTWLFVGTLRGQ